MWPALPFMAVSKALPLSAAQRVELQSYIRKQNLTRLGCTKDAYILALADGLSYREIIESLNTTAPTISVWKRRFAEEGVVGLGTIRPGQPAKLLTPELRAKILAKDV